MNSDSITTKAAVGRASTTMASYASPPTPFWRPSELGFPPLRLSPSSDPLPYPKVSARGVLPVRTERHNPCSITTVRWRHIRTIIPALPNCPWCGIDARGIL